MHQAAPQHVCAAVNPPKPFQNKLEEAALRQLSLAVENLDIVAEEAHKGVEVSEPLEHAL